MPTQMIPIDHSAEDCGIVEGAGPRTPRVKFGSAVSPARLFVVLLLAAGLGQSLGSHGQEADSTALSDGTWAGPGIVLSIKEGTALVEFDCAHGAIEGALQIDDSGHFKWKGQYEIGSGGPAQATVARAEENNGATQKQTTAPANASYEGIVNGREMTLTVTLLESHTGIGTFQLGEGQRPRLHKCQ
jgi:hypothetical protein